MADSCIISKEQLSQKEQFLKSKLYGGAAAVGGAAPLLQTTGHQTLQQNQRLTQTQSTQQSLPEWRQPKLYKETTMHSSSPQKIHEHHKTQLSQVTDMKMDTFLDEMRQQFMQTANSQVIPQSLLYQQTRMMEKQVGLLEQSQKAMGDVINNVMNQGATGVNSASALKQQVFNENRRMLLEMMAPLSQQLNEMKLLYENTKACSSDVGGKIDELKRVIANQQDTLNGRSGINPGFMTQQMNPYQQLDLLDPSLMKKGIEDLKNQMREVQREAHLIENDLQTRFTQMTAKNMQQRYLPQSITEEFNQFQHQLKEKTITDHISGFSTMTQTKEAVLAKLGGYFDYALCLEELRQILAEKDIIEREFKSQALIAPEFKDKAFGRVPPYDFSANSVFIRDPIKEQEWKEQYAKVSTEKPQYLQDLQAQLNNQPPKSFLDYESYKEQYQREVVNQGPLVKKTVSEYQPKSNNTQAYSLQNQANNGDRSTQNQKAVNDRLSKRNNNNQPSTYSKNNKVSGSSNPSSKHSTPSSSDKKRKQGTTGKSNIQDIKKMDLLSLKKQVIEELKSELDLSKSNQQQTSSQNKTGFDFTPNIDNIISQQKQNKNMTTGSAGKEQQLSQVIQQETDKQSQILAQIKSGQEQQINQQLRQSTQSLGQTPAFTQSLLENAFADLLMSELKKGDTLQQQDEEVKKLGEELFTNKLNNIFDELAKENQLTTQPIQQQPTATSYQQPFQQLQQQQQPQVQILDQQQQIQSQQPVVIPIVINQSNNQNASSNMNSAAAAHDLLKDQNKLRDMLSQVISAQLGMHNIRKEHGSNGQQDVNEMQDILGDTSANNKNRAGNNMKGGGMRDSMMSQDPLNQTSRTLQEEEAKLKAEQQELRKQTFINVQPYIQQTLSMGYQNPFAFGGGMPMSLPRVQGGLSSIQQPLINDLDQFNLTSDSSDFLSMDSSKYSDRQQFFRSVNDQTSRVDKQRSRSRQGGRYSTMSQGDRSDGEIGGVEQSDDDISVGEIRFPTSTLKQNQKPIVSSSLNNAITSTAGTHNNGANALNRQQLIPPSSSNNKAKNSNNVPPEIRKLGETINYEEDKDFSPEKDEEKPIMDSSDGPIPKPKARFGGGKAGAQNSNNYVQNVVGKSGANNLMSGESFGMNPYSLARGGLQGVGAGQQNQDFQKPKPSQVGVNSSSNKNNIATAGSRLKIEDNFLEEDYEDDFGSIRDSRESGEINPGMWK